MAKQIKRYKDIFVADGSELAKAIENNPKDPSVAEKVYKDTTERYKSLFSKEDREWFSQRSKQGAENGTS
jgi:hypothetical protein